MCVCVLRQQQGGGVPGAGGPPQGQAGYPQQQYAAGYYGNCK